MKFKPETPSFSFGIILTLIAYLLFATCSTFVRMLGKNFPTIQIVFFQALIPLICLTPLIVANGISHLKPVAIFPHLLRDINGVASYFAYFFAIKYIGLVDATVLTYSAPFYIPIIWSIWTKEKVQKEVWWIILLGFIGIIFILKPGTTIFKPSSFIGILAGILSAIVLASIGMLRKKKELLTNILFYNFFLSTLISLPFATIMWKNPTLSQSLLLLGIGLTTFFGQMLLTEGYKHGAASFLSPLSYSMVIYATFISWIFFNAPPGWLSFVGMIIVIIGGSTTYVLRKKPQTVSEVFEANNISAKIPWWKFWKKTP